MKRILSILLVLAMLSSLAVTAFADTWTCSECGEENTGEFCGECGAHFSASADEDRQIVLKRSEEWFCLNCGTISAKKFCTNCGEKRSAGLTGSFATFGAYEQDNNAANGKEPIEWLVLAEEGNKVLLLSRYGLDAKPYHTKNVDITWENCSLRSWLNGDFLKAAFTEKEQGAILTTSVDNSKSQCNSHYRTDGGNNTQDKIFLLSSAEANKYLGVQNYGESGASDNVASRMGFKAYTKAQGADTYGKKTADGTYLGWWWLRSPGISQDCAARVLPEGSLYYCSVTCDYLCVRPAFWVNLDSGIF